MMMTSSSQAPIHHATQIVSRMLLGGPHGLANSRLPLSPSLWSPPLKRPHRNICRVGTKRVLTEIHHCCLHSAASCAAMVFANAALTISSSVLMPKRPAKSEPELSRREACCESALLP